MDCEFCKKTFSSKPNLVAHRKNAKYCLGLQGKSNDHFKCHYCEKVFTCQQRLTEHKMSVCKMKDKANYENEISKIKDEFSSYKTQEKTRIQEKDFYYQEKLKEKDSYYQEKEAYYQEKLNEKNEYIAKLEAKLEKFENAVVTNISHSSKSYEEDDEEIPIPLGKKIDSIIIEEINDDKFL